MFVLKSFSLFSANEDWYVIKPKSTIEKPTNWICIIGWSINKNKEVIIDVEIMRIMINLRYVIDPSTNSKPTKLNKVITFMRKCWNS